MHRDGMPGQLKEYLFWMIVRHTGVGIFFFIQASFLTKDSYTSQLFQYARPQVWGAFMIGVAVLALAAIIKSSMLLARLAFTFSMGVTLMLTGQIIAVGILEDEVAPFLTLFLITFVGKDFAMARMPVISVPLSEINLRKGDGGR